MTKAYLDTFLNHEKNLKKFSPRHMHLERVKLVLARLGLPQNDLKVIHIAGSKGKGSTSAFTAHILQQAGYKVGLFTSPHLYDVRERIRIFTRSSKIASQNEFLSGCIPKEKFDQLIKKIRPQLELGRHHAQFGDLTYFEVLTIVAFCYFKNEKVDFVVLETGLGGRLDATNVCHALVSAITPISLEHTQQLGKTLSKISVEKAAIIKRSNHFTPSVAVIAPQSAQVMRVIWNRCRKVGARFIVVNRDIKTRFISSNMRQQKFSVNGKVYTASLLGRHQIINAAVAVGIIEGLRDLGFSINFTAVKKGIAATRWPLRFEIFAKSPPILLDGAHNPESCKRLAKTLRDVFPRKKVVLIFGSSDDKDVKGMLRYLKPLCSDMILASATHSRALAWTPENIKRFFKGKNVFVAESVSIACKFALKIAANRVPILSTGSIFLAAQVRKEFGRIL
ncbi:MAG: bifunctional folylpolyglutamate synthase/dihydrofolate synthase [Candidatus Omnitrophica bacterium]|nr:bifunctional folylpolyglutamate synthase/dihydrofolate synthase [Candidatus Omnitrophota bacterium]